MLLAVSRIIDAVTSRVGRTLAWLIVATILVSTVNAIVRKLFDTGSNAWLELQWVLFGAVFLLCAPWTLALGEHVRIDILSSRLSRRARDWIDVVGHLFFLLPIAAVMTVLSWPFFLRSAPAAADVWTALGGVVSLTPWRGIAGFMSLGEQSANSGGLPVWPAKFLLPVAFALLFLQGLSELIKRLAIMAGALPETDKSDGHAAAEAARPHSTATAKSGSDDKRRGRK